jgi:phenylpropionate dioxygenase-like ring-hydroxylating dioxygenase large terminal subunit
VFDECWLFAAHRDELPAPGDYRMLEAFDRIGHPLFLLHGADGKIRAFYNACRHRGGPLVDAPRGSAGRALVCKYHAWTYDLDGRLLGFPEAKNFPAGARSDCPGLKQVACDTWGPLVFVRLSADGPSLREHLEPIATELDELLGERSIGVHLVGTKQLDVACNWKAPGDGNIETYHVPFVHRESAAPLLDEKRTGQWLLPRGHSRMLIRFRQPLPDLPLPRFRGDTTLAELGVYSFHVFPNLSVVLAGPSSAFLITAFPDGVDRCAYYTHFLSPAPRTEQTSALIDALIEANWKVLLEDLANQVAGQKSTGWWRARRAAPAVPGAAHPLRARGARPAHRPERVPAALRVPPRLDRYVEKE